jgi:hypothetical protein
VLAVGDLIQVVRGDWVTSRLLFRFKDGSVDDETTVFSQRGNFQLITDHHIQKGPSFPQPMDLSIDVRSGRITVRSTGKDGKEDVTTEHMDLPPDLANGLILSIAKNIRPDTRETKVSMVVATPTPRLVKVAISPHGEESFSGGLPSQSDAVRAEDRAWGRRRSNSTPHRQGAAGDSDLDHRRNSSSLRERRGPTLSGRSRLDHRTD